MSKGGYCGRILTVIKKNHKEYVLVQAGNYYTTISECDFEKSLDMWMEDTEENNIYQLWWNCELQ